MDGVFPVCIEKADALEVAKAEESGGMEAAQKVWVGKEKCAVVAVNGYQAGRVVHKGEVTVDGKKVTRSVVEIVGDDGKPIAYLLTVQPVTAQLQVEPKRGGAA